MKSPYHILQKPDQVGAAIAKQRKIAGLTQAQVADALGLHITTISRIENGSIMPSMVRIIQLHALFGCPYYSFFYPDPEKYQPETLTIADMLRPIPREKRVGVVAWMRQLANLLK